MELIPIFSITEPIIFPNYMIKDARGTQKYDFLLVKNIKECSKHRRKDRAVSTIGFVLQRGAELDQTMSEHFFIYDNICFMHAI